MSSKLSSSLKEYPQHTGNVLMKHASFCAFALAFERLGYFSITSSLIVYFMRELKMSSVLSAQMQATFQSIVYMMPILGAFIGDTYSGRWRISVVALGLATLGAISLMFGALYKISILSYLSLFLFYAGPVAMIKPNVWTLGADQFHPMIPTQFRQREKYFGLCYWLMNIAAGTAFLVMNQIANLGMGMVTKANSFAFVYGAGACYVFIAFLILAFGGKKLFVAKPQSSAMIIFFRITVEAMRNAQGPTGISLLVGIGLLIAAVLASVPSFFVHSDTYDLILAAMIVVSCGFLIYFGRYPYWVEDASRSVKRTFTREQIQGVKDTYRLTPYVAFAIPFWVVYNQMNTTIPSQGCQMKYAIGSFHVGVNVMGVFDSVPIILGVPILNYWVYPYFKRICGGKFGLSPLRRIGIGLFITGVAMSLCGTIEIYRKRSAIWTTECTSVEIDKHWCTVQELGKQIPILSQCDSDNEETKRPTHQLHIAWQIMLYGCVGIGESFLAITYYDFFYSQVPDYMRSVCQAVQMLITSLGTMVGAVLNSVLKKWYTNNLDEGHLEYVFFVNMGLAWFMLILFCISCRDFEYKEGTSLMLGDDPPEIEEETDLKKELDYKSDSYYYSDFTEPESIDEIIHH